MAKRKERFKVGDRVRFEGIVVAFGEAWLGKRYLKIKSKCDSVCIYESELTKIRM